MTQHRPNSCLIVFRPEEDSYKHASMWEGANRRVIREVAGGESTTCATMEEPIHRLVLYEPEVVVEGDTATLVVDSEEKATCDFGPRGIHGGRVGLRIANAHTHFKEVEVRQSTTVRQYYYVNGQRVAMRQDGILSFIAGDHPSATLRTCLGTTSVVVDAAGNKVAESRHLPYGEVRWADGGMPTDYRFTGERLHEPLGSVYHMGARFYDAYLARWLSPDSIVPAPSNPQSLNRFSYVLNNALRYIDPTGHWYYDPGCDCIVSGGIRDSGVNDYPSYLEMEPNWTLDDIEPIPAEAGPISGTELGAAAAAAYAVYWSYPARMTYNYHVVELAELYYLSSAVYIGLGSSAPWYTPPGRQPFYTFAMASLFAGMQAPPSSRLSWQFRHTSGGTAAHRVTKGPVGDGLDSHHFIQHEWANRQSIPGYSYASAPAIRLSPSQHKVVNATQAAFRSRFGYNTTFRQELVLAKAGLRNAGVSEAEIRMTSDLATQYFGNLGITP